MSAQVFRGRTVLEAQRAALEQLGPEAVVLTTRSVSRPGVGGWFGASDVEVDAALREPVVGLRRAAGASLEVPFAAGAYATKAGPAPVAEVTALRAELKGDIRAIKTMIASVVVTKIDETDAPAGVVHAAWATKLPVSVMCFGQRVPEDIAPATVSALLDCVAPRAAGAEAVSA